MEQAPLYLLMPYATPANGSDSHLRPGVHIRWYNNPILGLPREPVRVERLDAEGFVWKAYSTALYVVDQYRRPVSLPHVLGAGEELFAYIPYPNRCLGVNISVRSGGSTAGKAYGEIDQNGGGFRPVAEMSTGGWIHGTGLQRVRINGPLTVAGIRWIDLGRIDEELLETPFELVEEVGLPIAAAARYTGFSDAESRADERVWNGAPLRMGMHDAYSSSAPAAAPSSTRDEELDRVRSILQSGQLTNILDQLLNDTSGLPTQLLSRQDMGGGVEGDLPLLHSLMLSLLDYGVTRWLGYGTWDDPQQREIVLYRISAQYNFAEVDLTAEDLPLSYRDQIEDYLRRGSPPLYTYVLVNRATSALPPRPVAASNWNVTPGNWTTGGDLILRQAALQFDGSPLDLPHQYALRRQQSGSSSWISLNQLDNDKRNHLVLSIMAPPNASNYRERRHLDLEVSAAAHRYESALADMFGRWSEWSGANLSTGSLIPPPAPVIQAEYQMAPAVPLDDLGRSGNISIKIPIPGQTTSSGGFVAEPAPGSPFITLVQLRMFSMDENGAETLISTHSLPVATNAPALVTRITAPLLGRGQQGIAVLRAHFQAGSLLSAEEGVSRLTVVDPRPPAALTLNPDVQYATLADSKGVSRVKLGWPAEPGHAGYRIFCASQRALEPYLSNLGSVGTAALTAAQDITTTPEALAFAIANLPGIIPRNLFTLLTPIAVAPAPSGQTTYTAQLPGRSRMLFVFRILAVGPSEVEEPWDLGAALQYVAVPSSIRLQPPQITLGPAANGLQLSIDAPGKQRVGRVRIFRANSSEISFKQMSQVAEMDMPAASVADSVQELQLVDQGPTRVSPGAQLLPWRTYTYRAQVQAPLPASSLATPALWSPPSVPVSKVNIPPGPPPLPLVDRIWRQGADVLLEWQCPDLKIKATDLGNHYYRILRVSASGGIAEEIYRADALLPTTFTDVAAPVGVLYLIEVIDPLGRASRTDASPAISITQLDFPLPSVFP